MTKGPLDRLFCAVLGDVMDRMGRTRQFLPQEIRPLAGSMVVAGRALTVTLEPVAEETDRDYGLLFEALDALRPGDVFLAGGACRDVAVWGELMTARALKLEAAGAVIDGPVRDTNGILAAEFPVFCRGSYGQDQAGRSKVMAYGQTLEVGRVQVSSGDLVFGDIDGVVVVPRAIEREVIERALEKVETEQTMLEELRGGMSAVEAFRKHGVF